MLDTSSSRAERTAFALEQVGLQPAVVRDASDVFHRVMEGGVELVVLQVPLREMSEVVFLKIVRSLAGARTLPIVLTSDIYEGDDPMVRSLLERGACAWLPPPSDSGAQWRSVLGHVGPLAVTCTGRSPMPRTVAPAAADSAQAPPEPTLKDVARVPDDAVVGQVHFGDRSFDVHPWDCEPGQLSVVCGPEGPTIGQDVRLELRLDVQTDDGDHAWRARILGVVLRVMPKTWGSLVRVRIRGAAPAQDFDAIVAHLHSTGRWLLP